MAADQAQQERDAAVGAAVLAALARGRARAIADAQARAAPVVRAIRIEHDRDVLRGFGPRGRAGRISRRLGGTPSRRQVARILAALYSASSSVRSDAAIEALEHP